MKTKIADILSEFHKTISTKRKHELKQILAEHYYVAGDFDESLRYFRSYLAGCEEANDKSNQMITHRRIGDCYLQSRSLDDALTHYQRYLKLSVSLKNRIEEQRAYHTIGESYFEKYEDEDVLSKKNKLLKLADLSYIKSYRIWESLSQEIDENERNEMLASNLLNRGLIDLEKENYESASRKLITSYVEAKKCASEIQLTCLLMLATVKMRIGNCQDAMFFLKEGKKLILSNEDEMKLKDKYFEVLISDNRFKKAAKCMQSAAKHKKEDKDYYIGKSKTALKMHKIQLRLVNIQENKEKTKLLEQMGDIYANEGIYRAALNSYQEMLTCSREGSHEEMATAHACLAVTNGDLGRFETALFHYEKEAELRSNTGAYNPEELVRTYLNIARFSFCLERSEESLSAAQKAKDLALTLQNKKLQVEAMKEELNATVALRGERSLEATRLRSAIDALKIVDEEIAIDAEESQSDDDDFGVDLEALSSDSSEESDGKDEEGVQIPGVALRKTKRSGEIHIKRNEKGETALHRACIDGRLATVRDLVISRHHPLNVEDHAGWSPLHDACNCGNLEIVCFLVEHGANVEHTGCPIEKNTPLLSAAEGGSLDVCVYLIKEKNVNVWHKNSSGANVMDLIDDCRVRSISNGTFDTEAAKNYRDFVAMLREHLGESKYIEFLRSRRGKKAVAKDSNKDEVIYDSSRRRFTKEKEDDAVSDYLESLQMVGGSSTRRSLAEKSNSRSQVSQKKEEKGYVVGDDWLVPDENEIPSLPSKGVSRRSGLIDTNRTRPETRSPSPKPAEVCASPKRKKARKSNVVTCAPKNEEVKPNIGTMSRASFPQANVSPSVNTFTDFEELQPSVPDVNLVAAVNDVPLSRVGSDNISSSNPASCDLSGGSRSSHLNAPMLPRCVRLLFNDISILIPLRDRALTVGWLLREFRKRCEALSNGVALPPIDQIILRSEDGDFFSAETDRLVDVLNVNNSTSIVNISVVTRDEASIKMFESKDFGCSFDKRPHLSVGGLKMMSTSNVTLLSCLSDQQVTHLSLQENDIHDNIFRDLSRSLLNFHECLTYLDLSKNCLTNEAVDILADLSPLPSNVSFVNLSSNNLGNDGIPALSRLLLRWPAIRDIDLSQCMITEDGMIKYQDEWTNAFTSSKLESLNMSYNALENKGIDVLLRSMNSSCWINALYLRGCIVYSDGSSIMTYFLKFLSSRDQSTIKPLSVLDIGSNRLTSGSTGVMDLIFDLTNCHLETLKVDDNRDLIKTGDSASRLLSKVFRKRIKHLEMDAPSNKESDKFCEALYCLLMESEDDQNNLNYLLLKRCTFSKVVFGTVMRANIANRKSLFFCEKLKNGSVILKRQ